MKRARFSPLALCASLAIVACDDGDPPEPVNVLGTPTALYDALLYLDAGESDALVLDVTSGELTRHDLPRGVVGAQLRPAQERPEAIVLCTGEEETLEEEGEAGHLLRMNEDGVEADYELPARFTEVQLSPDGRYAFLHTPTAGIVLPNEVAVVDLEAAPADDNPLSLSVRSLVGEQPRSAVFSEPVEVAGVSRRLLAILSDNHVNLVDMDHPEREEITVPLTLPSDAVTRTPRQVLFDGSDVYVRAFGGTGITVLQLNATAEPTAAGHDFSVSVVQLATTDTPSAMTLVDTEGGRRLLVVAGRRLDMLDPTTGSTDSVALTGDYNTMLKVDAASPGDSTVRPRALLYGNDERSVTFVDLDNVDERLNRSVEALVLEQEVDEALPLPELGLVAFVHGAESGRISVVDVADRTVTPVVTQGSLGNAVLDAAHARLWLASGADRVGFLGLGRFEAGEVLLDAAPGAVIPIEGDRPSVAVSHGGAAGFLTVLDAAEPSRSTARAFRGFLWEDLLDREGDD